MGFLKKLFGSPAPRPSGARAQQGMSEMANALNAYASAKEQLTIGERLDRIGSLDNLNIWSLDYDDFPQVDYSTISWEFGNFIQEVTAIERLETRVPAEISRGMPPNVKQDKVRGWWASASAGAVYELKSAVDKWEQFSKMRMEETHPYMLDVFYYLQQFSWIYLKYLYLDMSATIARWNGNPGAAQGWDDQAAAWKRQSQAAMRDVQSSVRELHDESEQEFDRLGFINEMWAFFGLDEFKD